MKGCTTPLFVLLCLLVGPSTASPQRHDDAEVKAAVMAFGRAFAEADVAVLDSLLTEDYVHINGRSGNVLARTDWLQWIASRRQAIASKELVITAYEIEDLVIRIYGEAAVVTGEVYSAGVEGGTAFSSRVRFTNLWVLENGRWQRAAFHDTPLLNR